MAAKTTDLETEVENITGLSIAVVERKFGIAGLDHVLKAVESRRKTLIYEADKERTSAPK